MKEDYMPSAADIAAENERARDASTDTREIAIIDGFDYSPVPADGHCLFSAVGIQVGRDPHDLRNAVADYLESHREDFSGLIPIDSDFAYFIENLRRDLWGGNECIVALQEIINRPIVVLQDNGSPIMMDNISYFSSSPVFLYYTNADPDNSDCIDARNHYDALIVRDDINPIDILVNITSANYRGERVFPSCIVDEICKLDTYVAPDTRNTYAAWLHNKYRLAKTARFLFKLSRYATPSKWVKEAGRIAVVPAVRYVAGEKAGETAYIGLEALALASDPLSFAVTRGVPYTLQILAEQAAKNGRITNPELYYIVAKGIPLELGNTVGQKSLQKFNSHRIGQRYHKANSSAQSTFSKIMPSFVNSAWQFGDNIFNSGIKTLCKPLGIDPTKPLYAPTTRHSIEGGKNKRKHDRDDTLARKKRALIQGMHKQKANVRKHEAQYVHLKSLDPNQVPNDAFNRARKANIPPSSYKTFVASDIASQLVPNKELFPEEWQAVFNTALSAQSGKPRYHYKHLVSAVAHQQHGHVETHAAQLRALRSSLSDKSEIRVAKISSSKRKEYGSKINRKNHSFFNHKKRKMAKNQLTASTPDTTSTEHTSMNQEDGVGRGHNILNHETVVMNGLNTARDAHCEGDAVVIASDIANQLAEDRWGSDKSQWDMSLVNGWANQLVEDQGSKHTDRHYGRMLRTTYTIIQETMAVRTAEKYLGDFMANKPLAHESQSAVFSTNPDVTTSAAFAKLVQDYLSATPGFTPMTPSEQSDLIKVLNQDQTGRTSREADRMIRNGQKVISSHSDAPRVSSDSAETETMLSNFYDFARKYAAGEWHGTDEQYHRPLHERVSGKGTKLLKKILENGVQVTADGDGTYVGIPQAPKLVKAADGPSFLKPTKATPKSDDKMPTFHTPRSDTPPSTDPKMFEAEAALEDDELNAFWQSYFDKLPGDAFNVEEGFTFPTSTPDAATISTPDIEVIITDTPSHTPSSSRLELTRDQAIFLISNFADTVGSLDGVPLKGIPYKIAGNGISLIDHYKTAVEQGSANPKASALFRQGEDLTIDAALTWIHPALGVYMKASEGCNAFLPDGEEGMMRELFPHAYEKSDDDTRWQSFVKAFQRYLIFRAGQRDLIVLGPAKAKEKIINASANHLIDQIDTANDDEGPSCAGPSM